MDKNNSVTLPELEFILIPAIRETKKKPSKVPASGKFRTRLSDIQDLKCLDHSPCPAAVGVPQAFGCDFIHQITCYCGNVFVCLPLTLEEELPRAGVATAVLSVVPWG